MAKPGIGTSDDYRFVRFSWEVPSSAELADFGFPFVWETKNQIFGEHQGRVNWSKDGREIKSAVATKFAALAVLY